MSFSLRRITTSSAYIAELDGLRFFAIMPVVFAHLRTHLVRHGGYDLAAQQGEDWSKLVRFFMTFGVPLFYCISGFILSLPFARHKLTGGKPIDFGGFYLRRLTRLEPPYLISLTAFFFIHLLINRETFAGLLPHFLASFFYVHNIVFGEWSKINPPAWTLEVELQFYLLAPFLASALFAIRSRLARRGLVVAAALFFVALEAMFEEQLAVYHLDRAILTNAHYFLAGFLICDWYLTNPAGFHRKSVRGDLLAVAGVGLTGLRFFVDLHAYVAVLAFLAGIVLIFLGGFQGTYLNRFCRWSPISIVGGMCYTIYLLHYPLVFFLVRFVGAPVLFPQTMWLDVFIWSAVYIPVIVVLCGVFFWAVERPCMDPTWPRKLWTAVRTRLPARGAQVAEIGEGKASR